MRKQTPSLADSFRMLADFLDEHPAIAEHFRYPSFREHQTRDEAANLDAFAETFGVNVAHGEPHGEKAPKPGARYSTVQAMVGVIKVELQARTEDYEAATGKTVEQAGESA